MNIISTDGCQTKKNGASPSNYGAVSNAIRRQSNSSARCSVVDIVRNKISVHSQPSQKSSKLTIDYSKGCTAGGAHTDHSNNSGYKFSNRTTASNIFGPLRVGDVDSYELDETNYYFPPVSPPQIRQKSTKQRLAFQKVCLNYILILILFSPDKTKPPSKSRTFFTKLFAKPNKLLKSLSIQGFRNQHEQPSRATPRLKKSATCPEGSDDTEDVCCSRQMLEQECSSNRMVLISGTTRSKCLPEIILEENVMSVMVLENTAALQCSDAELNHQILLGEAPFTMMTTSLTEEPLMSHDGLSKDRYVGIDLIMYQNRHLPQSFEL